jgi:protoheme IX farnesyltransferase
MEYMRKFSESFKLTKPGIAVLLDLVAITGFILGLRDLSLLWKIFPLLFAGTFASFSSSLTNNYLDRDIDSQMARTKWRTGIGSRLWYIASISSLLAASIIVSYVFLNAFTTLWIFLGYLSYSFLYTLVLKRRTSWNIVLGGIAGSFPALAGWSAINSPISMVSIFLAILVFLWTPTHFWTLAIKYREDYRRAGIPMMPSVKNEKTSVNYIIINTAILIVFSIIPVIFNMGFPFLYRYLVIPVSIYLLIRVILLRTREGGDLKKYSIKAFLASNYYLTAILILLLAGSLIRFI